MPVPVCLATCAATAAAALMRAAALLIGDPSLRAAVTFALESRGIRVEIYQDLARLLDAGTDAGCLIIDIPPGDIRVIERLDALRHRPGRVPVVVLASCPSRRTREGILAAGATLVEKPLLTDAFCETACRLIEAQSAKHARNRALPAPD